MRTQTIKLKCGETAVIKKLNNFEKSEWLDKFLDIDPNTKETKVKAGAMRYYLLLYGLVSASFISDGSNKEDIIKNLEDDVFNELFAELNKINTNGIIPKND